MPLRRAAARALALAALAVPMTACDEGEPGPEEALPGPVTEAEPVGWEEQALPRPPGRPGRSTVRDVVHCGGRWYVVGGVLLDRPTEDQDARPAAWVADPAGPWRPLPVRTTTFWGARAVLESAACSRGRIAVVGSRTGGAHGNPRVTTFRLAPDGALVDVEAVVTQFGGSEAVNVGVVGGGAAGWLIVGNRASGPAVWVTDDPRGFRRVEGEPGLTASGRRAAAHAGTGAGDGDGGWVVVGAVTPTDDPLERDPAAWTSTDGLAWSPEPVPADGSWEDLQRVAPLDDGQLLAAGLADGAFATWVRDDEGGWHRSAGFGELPDDLTSAAYVASLAPSPSGGALATVSTGQRFELWRTTDGADWRRVDAPLTPGASGDHSFAVATSGDRVVLVADDGSGARVWSGRDEG